MSALVWRPLALVLAAAATAILLWAVMIYGPQQHRAGAAGMAEKLDAATRAAQKEMTNAADRARLARRMCLDTGGVHDFATGECLR